MFDLLLVDYDHDHGKGVDFVRVVRAQGDHIITVGVSSHDEGNAALRLAGASAFRTGKYLRFACRLVILVTSVWMAGGMTRCQ